MRQTGGDAAALVPNVDAIRVELDLNRLPSGAETDGPLEAQMFPPYFLVSEILKDFQTGSYGLRGLLFVDRTGSGF